MQRKGFTLVELLVVVVVLATLMSITFRIANAGDGSASKSFTINRLQRIENCLSGYYAAFGSYPPVQLHGSRNYRYETSLQGIQQVGENGGEGVTGNRIDYLKYDSVIAACRSQPLAMEYPFTRRGARERYQALSDAAKEKANSGDESGPFGRFVQNQRVLSAGYQALTSHSYISDADKRTSPYWTDVQVFKFGLLSYLLPRYLIMMGNQNDSTVYDYFEQWKANNSLPCRFEDGSQYSNWQEVNQMVLNDPWEIAILPSQAVCARWLPNLKDEIITGSVSSMSLYGIEIKTRGGCVGADTAWPQLYSADRSQGNISSTSKQYLLEQCTIYDGYEREFFYYSPPPYQTYRVWSSGPNHCTFPPWVTGDEFREIKDEVIRGSGGHIDLGNASDITVSQAIADDIVQMSN